MIFLDICDYFLLPNWLRNSTYLFSENKTFESDKIERDKIAT